MDLHVPEGPVRSLKDFLLHIGIVTIGILIALGLEQAVEAHHRAHLAREAVDGFTRELTYDRDDLKEIVSLIEPTHQQIDALIANLSSPAPGEIVYPKLHIDILPTTSWDVAMATQALSELPYDQAHLYAEAYDQLRLIVAIEQRVLNDWMDLKSYGEDGAKLTPDQRRTLIERLNRYKADTATLGRAGTDSMAKLDQVLGGKPHA